MGTGSDRTVYLSASAVAAIGATALVGWITTASTLRRVFCAETAVNPVTALALVAAATGLALALRRERSSAVARIALGLTIALLGALRLGVDVGLIVGRSPDEMLFASQLAGNRMAPNTAIALVGIGAALATLDTALGRRRPSTWLLTGVAMLSSLAIVGYTFNVLSFYRVATHIAMALPTALGLLLVSVGLVFSRPEREPVATLRSESAGGVLARTLAPVAVLLPLVLGWIRLEAQRHGLMSVETGVCTMVVANAAVFLLVVWWSSRALAVSDLERTSAQEQLRGLASSDELTGLRNRRGFLEQARVQLVACERRSLRNAVVFMDLDGLKRINDVQGHGAGDRAIVDFADVLRRMSRSSDVVARLGGYEFVVLLVGGDADGYARRLAAELGRHNAEAGRPYDLAASIGTSPWQVGDADRDVDARLAEADNAMYAMKSRRAGTVGPGATTQAAA